MRLLFTLNTSKFHLFIVVLVWFYQRHVVNVYINIGKHKKVSTFTMISSFPLSSILKYAISGLNPVSICAYIDSMFQLTPLLIPNGILASHGNNQALTSQEGNTLSDPMNK